MSLHKRGPHDIDVLTKTRRWDTLSVGNGVAAAAAPQNSSRTSITAVHTKALCKCAATPCSHRNIDIPYAINSV